MGKVKEIVKVKINFNEPHITYRLDDGSPVVGVTTAIKILDKPALTGWAFNQGREPAYENIPDAEKRTGINLEKLSKNESIKWAFGVGQKRIYSSLRGSIDNASNIGTVAHEILKGRELGYEIDNSNITPENWEAALESVKSHDRWFKGLTIKTIFVETPLVSNQFMYGGTLDKYAFVTEEKTLIDYKSGSGIYDDYFIQLAGYCKLLIEFDYPVERAITVNMPKLKGDNFKIEDRSVKSIFEAGYFDKFLNCVATYYTSKNIKSFNKGKGLSGTVNLFYENYTKYLNNKYIERKIKCQ